MLLKNEEIRKEMIDSFEKGDKIEELREEYKSQLEKNGIPTFTDEEISSFRKSMENLKFTPEAQLIVQIFFDDVNSIIKTSHEHTPGVGRYNTFPVGRIKNNLSYRWLNSISKYCKALALVLGEEGVTPEIVSIVMPYTLPHRIEFENNYVQSNLKDEFFPGSQ
jgi:hypothetical protein